MKWYAMVAIVINVSFRCHLNIESPILGATRRIYTNIDNDCDEGDNWLAILNIKFVT